MWKKTDFNLYPIIYRIKIQVSFFSKGKRVEMEESFCTTTFTVGKRLSTLKATIKCSCASVRMSSCISRKAVFIKWEIKMCIDMCMFDQILRASEDKIMYNLSCRIFVFSHFIIFDIFRIKGRNKISFDHSNFAFLESHDHWCPEAHKKRERLMI